MVKAKQAVFILILLCCSQAWADSVERNITRTLSGETSVYHQGTVPSIPYTVVIDNWDAMCSETLLMDDQSATYTDAWTYTEDPTPVKGDPIFGAVYYIAKDNVDGSGTATFTPNIKATQDYHVWWYRRTLAAAYSTNQPITVVYNGGSANHTMNNRSLTGGWEYLGTYEFAAGTSGYVVTNNDADDYVQADAVIFQAADNKPIIVLDDDDAAYVITGAWTDFATSAGYLGDLQYTTVNGGDKYITATPTITKAGNYRVWSKSNNAASNTRCNNTEYIVTHNGAGSPSTVLVNQEINPGLWVSVGVYNFAAGTGGSVQITNEDDNCNNTSTDVVIADGVMFEYVGNITGHWTHEWQDAGTGTNYYGPDYLRIAGGGAATDCFKWIITLQDGEDNVGPIKHDGTYKVFVMAPSPAADSCNAVDYTIVHTGGSHVVTKDHSDAQYVGRWLYLGSFPFDTEGDYYVEVCADNCTSAKWIRADAIKLELLYQNSVENGHNVSDDRFFQDPELDEKIWVDAAGKLLHESDLRCISYDYETSTTNRAYAMLWDGDPVIVDEDEASFVGAGWSTQSTGGWEHDRKQIASGGDGSSTGTYGLTVADEADYEVWVNNPLYSLFCSDCSWTINYNGGSDPQTIDMTASSQSDSNQYEWNRCGVYPFAVGTGNTVVVTDDADGTYVVADVVKFQKVKEFTKDSDFGFVLKLMIRDSSWQAIIGFNDEDTASNITNFVGFKVNTSQYALFDIYPIIYDNAGIPDTGTVLQNVLRCGNEVLIKGQYVTSNDTLTITGYDPVTETQLWTSSVTLTEGRDFSVNSRSISCDGDGAGTYRGYIWDWSTWEGTSETFRTSSTAVYYPSSFDFQWVNAFGLGETSAALSFIGFPWGFFFRGGSVGVGVPTITKINDKTYIGYVGQDFNYYISEYDHTTGAVAINPTQIAGAGNDHGHYSITSDGTDIHIFGGCQNSAMKYYRSSGENVTSFAYQGTVTVDTTYPFSWWFPDEEKLLVTYNGHPVAGEYAMFINSTDVGPPYGDTWSAETQLTDWNNASAGGIGSHVYYPILGDQAENDDVYVGLSIRDSAVAIMEGTWVVKTPDAGTTWENVEGDDLALPIMIPGEHRSVAAISGTSIDCNPSDDWTVDYLSTKWVKVKTCAATPGINGNWYTIASNDADQIVTDTDLDALGLAAGDTVFIGEKNIEVYYDPEPTDTDRYPGDMHVYGSGASPYIFGVSYDATNQDTYFWTWDAVGAEWDNVLVDDDFYGTGIYATDEDNIAIYGIGNITAGGPPYSVLQKYTSTDGGASWSLSSTLHEPYWGDVYNGLSASVRYNRTCLPKHNCSTDMMFLMSECNHPQGLYQAEGIQGNASNFIFGTSDPTYLMNHNVQEVSWTATGTGSATVHLRCASTEYGLRSATWRDVTNGQTDFSSWPEFASANFVQVQPALNYQCKIEDLIVTIGGVNIKPMIYYNNLIRGQQ